MNIKQDNFNKAMELYHSRKRYRLTGKLAAFINISLQVVLLTLVWSLELTITSQVLAVVMAFVLTDFLNGLIHMVMDNNESYDRFYGPFVANFHLHHQTPKYVQRPLAMVYFNETGSKLWLVPFQVLVLVLVLQQGLGAFTLHVLVYICILSSIAEVSHYLSHTSTSNVVRWLGNAGILLSWKHHRRHHSDNNTNYAFLNGMSDPLINWLARSFYTGYKQTTDQHYVHYVGNMKTDQR